MSFSLDGHVALVTGSSAGLGKAIALKLGQAGAKVAINYNNNESRAKQALAELEQQGCQAILVRGDVTQPEDVAAIYEAIASQLGTVDILVLNATGPQPQIPFEEYTWQDFQTMLDFFVKSPYLLTRICLPSMKQKQWGRIINISSDVCFRTVNNSSAYVTAKSGQLGFTRSMATELAPFGITVNAVAPGWIPVERHESVPQEKRDAYQVRIPMQRWGIPQDIAETVLYFASDESGFITGQYLCINGGFTLM
ncbi:SDR family NAD(P)-dependent oxidoreductase [Dolichospermum circinale]|uniref:SDR family NAD(P)-dependent oxidoreductase n=1 Tax=Dolichospermum circinale TaxID=109265 RepID=UPI000414E898|nr:3-oxoacyl-ACP reductase family protein [Dolichospermum circinale]MDB9475052.1 3-oxoacyl-ACP reductase FabG [Dolichospermum circinale CS-537/11]MDB9480050.1 3-oxoacyl-ACP reductase FabG [Dolichospermum circinale CS-537/03]MDB9483789.1 3-oxoacyl-ACP reductase FabG [Dolichospermum circinale CS-537/05]